MKKLRGFIAGMGILGFLFLPVAAWGESAEHQAEKASFALPKEDKDLLDSLVVDPVKKSNTPTPMTDLATLPFDTRLLDKEPPPEKETLLTLDQCMSILPKAAQGWEDFHEEMQKRSVSQPS